MRSALIVATYAYDDSAGLTTLRAPQQDAEALGAVLGDPDIGGFDVRTVVNQPSHVVNLEVARFFADRKPDELLLLHFSCHGVKDDSGELYFATTDTRLDVLDATAVSAASVHRAMTRSRSSRVVLLLDCCYAGAFARGMTSRGGPGLDLGERLAGKGRAVITASSALQFAFEDGDLATGDPDQQRPSVFTRSLVEGLRTGEADRDLDGLVSLDELYHYVHDEVTAASPHQTPSKWVFGLEGDLFLARRGMPVRVPSPLPPEIVESMGSSVAWQREAVIPELKRVLHGSHPGRALAARQALVRLSDDDSRKVAMGAVAVLATTVPEQRLPLSGGGGGSADDGELVLKRRDPFPDALGAGRTAERGSAQGPPALPNEHPPPRRPADPPTEVIPVARRLSSTRRPWALAAIGLAVTLFAALAWWLVSLRSAPIPGAVAARPLDDDIAVISKPNGKSVPTLTAVRMSSGAVLNTYAHVPGRMPSLSPDRRWLVYIGGAAALDGSVHDWVAYRVRADGLGSRPLFSSPSPTCRFTGRVAWNPGAAHELLINCRDHSGPTGVLQRATIDGTRVGDPISVPGISGDPTWTGDGHIIYTHSLSKDGPAELYRVTIGKRPSPEPFVQVPKGNSDFDPTWSRSKGLLFVRASKPWAYGTIMASQGGHPHPVDGIPVNARFPSSSPDGTGLAFLGVEDQVQTLWRKSPEQIAQATDLSGKLGPPAWGSR